MQAESNETPPRERRPRRTWLTYVKLAIVALVVAGVAQTLYSGWGELQKHQWKLDYGWLAASAALYVISSVPNAWFWRRTMADLGGAPGRFAAFRAFFVGHLGKYVPGKAMVVVLRAGLSKAPGVSAAVATLCVFYETLFFMALGSLLAAALLIALDARPFLILISLALMAATGLPVAPPIFRLFVKRFAPAINDQRDQQGAKLRARAGYPASGTLTLGVLALVLGWWLQGASLWACVKALEPAPLPADALPRCTAAAALGTVAGFVSMIPAGAGVRELALQETLAPLAGENGNAVALRYALVSRLVIVVSEIVASAILYLPWRKRVASGAETKRSADGVAE